MVWEILATKRIFVTTLKIENMEISGSGKGFCTSSSSKRNISMKLGQVMHKEWIYPPQKYCLVDCLKHGDNKGNFEKAIISD